MLTAVGSEIERAEWFHKASPAESLTVAEPEQEAENRTACRRGERPQTCFSNRGESHDQQADHNYQSDGMPRPLATTVGSKRYQVCRLGLQVMFRCMSIEVSLVLMLVGIKSKNKTEEARRGVPGLLVVTVNWISESRAGCRPHRSTGARAPGQQARWGSSQAHAQGLRRACARK